MQKVATENIFLLEFLVDNVSIDPTYASKYPSGETCVCLKFLDNDPMDVCEEDFSPKRDYEKDDENVKSGKSCLFSLTPDKIKWAVNEFDLFVKVTKKNKPMCHPPKVCVGCASIPIAELFCQIVEYLQLNQRPSPTAKTLKDTFDIENNSGTVVGKINVYVRLSCFGKNIVTHIQMNLDDKSILFKDKEGQSLFRYKKSKPKSLCPPPTPTPRTSNEDCTAVNVASCPINFGKKNKTGGTVTSGPYGPPMGGYPPQNYSQRQRGYGMPPQRSYPPSLPPQQFGGYPGGMGQMPAPYQSPPNQSQFSCPPSCASYKNYAEPGQNFISAEPYMSPMMYTMRNCYQ